MRCARSGSADFSRPACPVSPGAEYALGESRRRAPADRGSRALAATADLDARVRWRATGAKVLAQRGHFTAARQLAGEAVAQISGTSYASLLAECWWAARRCADSPRAPEQAEATCAKRCRSCGAAGRPNHRPAVQQDCNQPSTTFADSRLKRPGDPAQAKTRQATRRGPVMLAYAQLIKAHHDELLRAAARDRLAAQARRARAPQPHHPMTAPVRRLTAIRLRSLFS